jgi:hypothetical protein
MSPATNPKTTESETKTTTSSPKNIEQVKKAVTLGKEMKASHSCQEQCYQMRAGNGCRR